MLIAICETQEQITRPDCPASTKMRLHRCPLGGETNIQHKDNLVSMMIKCKLQHTERRCPDVAYSHAIVFDAGKAWTALVGMCDD